MAKWTHWELAGLFFGCLGMLLILPVLAPTLKLCFMAPFLVTAVYCLPRISTLWAALLVGFILDCLIHFPLWGLHTLATMGVTALLYQGKQLLFADKTATIPIMTGAFSSLFALAITILTGFSGIGSRPSLAGFLSDVFIYPLADAAYCAALLVAPKLYRLAAARLRKRFGRTNTSPSLERPS